jgi:hypothetical protein
MALNFFPFRASCNRRLLAENKCLASTKVLKIMDITIRPTSHASVEEKKKLLFLVNY